MYLSYTGYKAYTSCARMYWHQYVGKTKLDVPDNRVNALYGTVVGGLFAVFYNDRLWRAKDVEQRLLDMVPAHFERAVAKESKDGAVRWKTEDPRANYESPEDLLKDVKSTIPRGLSIIRHYRLLGPDQSEAEVKLDHPVKGHIIGGRADFLIKRDAPYFDRLLLDGKGSKWRDRYVDVRQLKWYALLYRLKYGFLPDKIGFLFWRFEAEEALDWVPFTDADLSELLQSTLDAMNHIEEAKVQLAALEGDAVLPALDKSFPVDPGDRCRLCAFRPVCREGQNFHASKVTVPDGVGVEDVGFGR